VEELSRSVKNINEEINRGPPVAIEYGYHP